MNEKIDVNVKELKPFTRFLYTIGELPTSYLMSMTYEEQLIWLCNYLKETVIPTVNNNAEAVKEVQDIVMLLQDYINNYFDNLDVQEEINKKLDNMAEDGSLTNLLNIVVDNRIIPLIDEQNNNIGIINNKVENQYEIIDNINSKVNSVSSGSPSGSYATEQDLINANPDHSKIYVVRSNNKWYYYNTSLNSWSIGGDYLSNNVKIDTISSTNIFLNNITDNNTNPFLIAGKYYGADGEFIINNNWFSTIKFPVNEGDIINVNNALQDYLIKWDNNKAYIGKINAGSTTTSAEYVVENNVKYVSFNIFKSNQIDNLSNINITINSNSIFNHYNLKWFELQNKEINPEKINSLENSSKNLLKFLIRGSYYNEQGDPIENSNWNRTKYKIPIKAYDKIEVINGRGITILIMNNNDEVIQAYPHTFEQPLTLTYYISENFVSQNASYILFNVTNMDLDNYDLKINGRSIFNIYSFEWLNINYDNLSNEIKNLLNTTNKNKWYDKKLVMYGDSIVAGSPGTTPYSTLLKNYLELNTSTNEGVSGRPIADGTPNGSGTVTTVANTINNYNNYDLVIIAGGTNDFKLNVPLGEILNVNSNNYDRNTFTGAYQHLIENIIKTKSTIRLILMTPLQRNNSGYDIYYTNSANCKLSDYCQRIKELGQLYSLPVIDMYSNSGMNLINLFDYTLDGLHPNNTGYELLTDYLAHQLVNL